MISGGGPAQRGRTDVPVKLDTCDSIDESWLADFDTERSEYLRRLETDRSIIAELRVANSEGAHYTYFATEMAKYGVAVMTAGIRTHQIFAKMQQRRLGGLPAPLGDELRDQDVAESIAGEAVADALRNFRTFVLIPGRWDPSRGASIRTYFIGQCLLRFANIYRAWHRETYDLSQWGTRIDEDDRAYEHVEQEAHLKMRVSETLAKVKKPRTKEILLLSAAGYTHEQIAAQLDMTTKAVEMSIRNERKRQMKEEAG